MLNQIIQKVDTGDLETVLGADAPGQHSKLDN